MVRHIDNKSGVIMMNTSELLKIITKIYMYYFLEQEKNKSLSISEIEFSGRKGK